MNVLKMSLLTVICVVFSARRMRTKRRSLSTKFLQR